MRKRISEQLKEQLVKFPHVSTTVDIWSDRTMRGYLGITVHGVLEEEKQLTLQSYLLTCQRLVTLH